METLKGLNIYVCSLGCAKNLVDTEHMLGALAEAGLEITDDPRAADVILVNTCAFIGPAREESIETILELASHKVDGKARILLVAGCMAERYSEELMAEAPEIDAVIGVGDWPSVVEVLKECLMGNRVRRVSGPSAGGAIPRRSRVITTGPFAAYVKIAEGCDNRCNYCAIPSIRGPLVSRDLDEVAGEIRALTGAGVKEITLIAQDLTAYGRERGGPFLVDLIDAILKGGAPPWLRLLYCYPSDVTARLIEYLAEGSVCRYLDIPMQHGSGSVLRAMGRRGQPEEYLRIIEELRRQVPGVFLRSSFMLGHPGESQKEFEKLLEFLKAASLDRVGFFKYSPEEGTPSGKSPDQVGEEEKEERLARAVSLQMEISLGANRQRIGEIHPFLVESGKETLVGRLQGQAPEVDGVSYLAGEARRRPEPGQIIDVRITGANDADFTCAF